MKKLLECLKIFFIGKNFRIMRISLFLLFACFFQVFAANNYAQNKKLTLSMDKATIAEVLKAIEDQSEFKFTFNNQLIDVTKRVDVGIRRRNIWEVLESVLPDAGITYRVVGKQVALFQQVPGSGEPAIQQQPVTGIVTDEDGNTLPGVNIIIKGTLTGVITDLNGNYSIEVDDPDATLVFSFIGMLTQEIEVSDQTEINITMAQDIIGLEEVVAIGYGTQRRKEVTSSIATVREKDFNQGAITSSPLQLVQGKIAGLAISRAHGGDPTADVHMLLRGISTIRGDLSPLIIIDGVPGGNINTISPEDIESIDVLRDGSAAAIYGTRGNAGVIIITTKKGTPGRLAIAYSTYVYTETWANKPRVLNASEWKQMKTDFQNSGNPILQGRAISIIDYGDDTDWFNEITRKAPMSNVHSLSLTGGTESTSYFASMNYRDLQGFIDKSNNNLLNGRLSLTHSGLNDKLIVQMNLSNSLRKSNPVNYQVYRHALGRNPTMPVYNDDGTFFEVPGWQMYNPVAILQQYQRDEERIDLLANTKIT